MFKGSEDRKEDKWGGSHYSLFKILCPNGKPLPHCTTSSSCPLKPTSPWCPEFREHIHEGKKDHLPPYSSGNLLHEGWNSPVWEMCQDKPMSIHMVHGWGRARAELYGPFALLPSVEVPLGLCLLWSQKGSPNSEEVQNLSVGNFHQSSHHAWYGQSAGEKKVHHWSQQEAFHEFLWESMRPRFSVPFPFCYSYLSATPGDQPSLLPVLLIYQHAPKNQ